MMAVGKMPGISMYHIRFYIEAPSTIAASYNDWSIPAKAAKYIIALYPVVCQIPDHTYIVLNHLESPRN